jgi:hypothetical protein
MSKIIGFGVCSKYYLYILITVAIKWIKDSIFGFSFIERTNQINLQIIDPPSLFSKHNLIQNTFKYFGFIIGGLIFNKIKAIKTARQKRETININEEIRQIQKIKLNYTIRAFDEHKYIEVIIIALIICVHFELTKILYLMNLSSFDFWTIDLVFIMIFMHKYFKKDLYTYQKISLYFIIITNTILLLISTFLHETKDVNKNSYNLLEEMAGHWLYFIPALLGFILLSGIISFARVKIKLLIEIKFISVYTIIIYIGICGFILTLIELAFSESFECNLNEMSEIFKPLCLVNDTNNISYYDEVVLFFDNINSSNAYTEILLIIFFPLVCFIEIMFELLIIFHLDPFFILIKDNLYYFLVRIIFIFFNINNNIENYLTERFYLLESAEILALIGTCVYLQIIELRIYQLDKNLNKNIIEREIQERKIKLFNIYGSSGSDYYNIEEEQQLDLTKSSVYV